MSHPIPTPRTDSAVERLDRNHTPMWPKVVEAEFARDLERDLTAKRSATQTELLLQIAGNEALLDVGRLAVEDELLARRDARFSQGLRRNGLVVSEADGTASNVIRIGTEGALEIGLKAIAAHLGKSVQVASSHDAERDDLRSKIRARLDRTVMSRYGSSAECNAARAALKAVLEDLENEAP